MAASADGGAAESGAGATPAIPNHLVIYDGVCHLCDGTVKFLLARDPDGIFRFCALQSATAAPILAAHGITPEAALRSITYIEDGVAYSKSAAALMIGRHLPTPYNSLASAAFCVPACLRDVVYDTVATNRYRLFGRSDECMRPSKAVMSRFIDAHEHAAARARAAAAAAKAATEAAPASRGGDGSDGGVLAGGTDGVGAASTAGDGLRHRSVGPSSDAAGTLR